jgi:hypothetical protein
MVLYVSLERSCLQIRYSYLTNCCQVLRRVVDHLRYPSYERRRLTWILYDFCRQMPVRDAAEESLPGLQRRRDLFGSLHQVHVSDDVVLFWLLVLLVAAVT